MVIPLAPEGLTMIGVIHVVNSARRHSVGTTTRAVPQACVAVTRAGYPAIFGAPSSSQTERICEFTRAPIYLIPTRPFLRALARRIRSTGYKRTFEELQPRSDDITLTASWWATGGRSSLGDR